MDTETKTACRGDLPAGGFLCFVQLFQQPLRGAGDYGGMPQVVLDDVDKGNGDLRVELGPGAAPQLGVGFLLGLPGLIGSVGGHGIEAVGN